MNDIKAIESIKVYKNDIFAGHLFRTKEGSELVFDDQYKAEKLNSQFTFKIQVKGDSLKYVGVGLPPYFAGLLPEGLRLKALVKKIKTSEDDLYSLLVASGGDPVGDIHFKELETENNSESKIENDIFENFSDIKKRLKDGEDPSQSPLAGVQEKISADRISIPIAIKKKNKSYILKLASTEFPEVIQNENVCLEIAKYCGLIVNKAKIIKDSSGEEALLVERFDREWIIKAKQWNRHHQEDACQFLDRYPADKYRIAFQDIAKGITEISTSPEIEVLKLLQLKAFSYLIGNGDLHAKNISLIQKNETSGIQLSPIYDVLCTALYGDQNMALKMDGKNQNLKRKNFLEFAERYDVSKNAMESMLDRLVERFIKYNKLFFSFPLALKKEKFIQQLFSERIKHLNE